MRAALKFPNVPVRNLDVGFFLVLCFSCSGCLFIFLLICHVGEQGVLFLWGKEGEEAELHWFIKKYPGCLSFAHHCTICCAWLHSHSLTETVELLLVISSLWL